MSVETATFHWADYLVFALCMAGSAGFAFVSCIMAGKKTAKEMLMGGQDVKFPAVAMSLVASFLTAPFILGTPAEIYFYGTMFYMCIIGYCLATPIVCHFFLVIFHRLKLVTAYMVRYNTIQCNR